MKINREGGGEGEGSGKEGEEEYKHALIIIHNKCT